MPKMDERGQIMGDKWLTLKEAAERLSVSTDTMRRWLAKGEIEGRQLPGGHWRIKLSEIERLLAA